VVVVVGGSVVVVDDDVVTTGSVVGAGDADGVARLHAPIVPSAIASATTPPIAVRPPVMDEQGYEASGLDARRAEPWS
jgi:hypothetical protein